MTLPRRIFRFAFRTKDGRATDVVVDEPVTDRAAIFLAVQRASDQLRK